MSTPKQLGTTGVAVRVNVTRLRQLRNLTYAELSTRLRGYGRPIPVLGLSRLERGERRVDVDDLVALAAVLEVSVASLLAESECDACRNKPPIGFTCNACGRAAA